MEKIETKGTRIVNRATLIVAVDIGKQTHIGYWRCPDKTESKPFEFHNDRSGFEKLWLQIAAAKVANGLNEIVLGFESTGAYAEPLAHFLKDKPVKLVQVNPHHTKKLKEVVGNSPEKTDKKDPKVIADIIELDRALSVIIPEGASAELRRLTQARERAIHRRTALLNQLQDLVFISFPEFLQVMKGVKSKTARYLLSCYPHAEDIVEVEVDALTSAMKRVSRGRLGVAKAKALHESAEESICVREGRMSVSLEIRETLSAIKTCDQLIELFEGKMCQHLEEIPYSNLLLSMKGIGKVTVAGLIGETADFRKFQRERQILKHAGFNLFEISSGKRQGNKKISKRGRSQMRKLLYFAALNTVRQGGIMHEFYQRHLQKGMKRMKALIAVARKLLRIMFALVRKQCEYIDNYEVSQLQKAA